MCPACGASQSNPQTVLFLDRDRHVNLICNSFTLAFPLIHEIITLISRIVDLGPTILPCAPRESKDQLACRLNEWLINGLFHYRYVLLDAKQKGGSIS